MDTSSSSSLSHQYAIIFAWLLCSILMFNNTCICSTLEIRCNEKDKHALLNFKQGVTDLSGKLSIWSIQLDCCQWEGVTCDNVTDRVTELSLRCPQYYPPYRDEAEKSHCLSGSIHLSSLLLDFEFLTSLDLSYNDFLSIQVDDSMDSNNNNNCHNLSIGATHPPNWCVNSSILSYLDLSENENLVIDNLQWLSRLSSLEYLNLRLIDLHRVTNWLKLVTMLPSLSLLDLSQCHLEDISPSLHYANFTTLQHLLLAYNNFHSELPKWLFNLSSDITTIDLLSNSFKGQLPEALPNFPNLELLHLASNKLDGQIPNWFGKLEYLQRLDLQSNMFSGSVPISLGNSSSLIELNIAKNQLTGVVSEKNFAKLSKLQILGIHSKTLIPKFDPHWIPPFQLTQLTIGYVGPKLPAWVYTQRSIQYLNILDSKLSFESQTRFWNFASRVKFFNLESNSIGGDLSNVVLNSTMICLKSNYMKGGLPRLSSNARVVYMRNNSLSGSISPLLCDHKMMNGKSNLMYLDISNNHLTGGLTNCWKNWKSLVHINLGTNNLTGNIPLSMGLLSNLTSLHLHENNLSGEIPLSLQNCHSLLVLNVRDNKFSGNIPNWMAKTAKILQLRSNQFNGDIPPQICQMSSLTILDLGDNRISGHIPNCLHNMSALIFNNATYRKLSFYFELDDIMRYYFGDSLELITKGQGSQYTNNLHFVSLVDLSSNCLSGTIPSQMFSLTGLKSLNFSHNKLMGEIPKEIGNMKNLESLDFSTNQLSGEIPKSMSSLSFLSYLNLSLNNFRGEIPSGTQLQGFSALSYFGNPDLCGPPITKSCSPDDKSKDTKPKKHKEISEFMSWFCIGIESGFVSGFLGVCGAIFLNRRWRHAYFNFLYDLRDRLYVMVVAKLNSIR